MPKEPTPRLKLKNPSTGEFDWDKSWWENTDILDNYPGILVVTESTLPEEPWVGQHVFNMDDLSLLCWNGANWINQSSGMFDYLTAGPGGVNRGDVVYIDSNGYIQKVSNDMEEKYAFRVAGIVLRNLTEGEKGLVKKTGVVRSPDWNLTKGKHYYLGTNGGITDIKPEIAENFAQVIGVATAVDALSIRISSPYVSYEDIKIYIQDHFHEASIREYGLEWNQTNDEYTRLMNAEGLNIADAYTDGYKSSIFTSVYPWSDIERVNLADDGTINAVYGDPEYDKNGSNGQVMVRIPKFWYKTENDTTGDNIYRWWIAEGEKEGFDIHPAFFRNGIERDYIYVGAFETGENNGLLESKGGLTPSHEYTISEYRTKLNERGEKWSQIDFFTCSAIQLLYLIEYADFNSQACIGKGVTDILIMNSGGTIGNKSYGYISRDDRSCSYRGIENIWGATEEFVEGIALRNGKYFIEKDISNFNNSLTNYTETNYEITSSHVGYTDDIKYSNEMDYAFLGKTFNGDSNTYLSDRYYEVKYEGEVDTVLSATIGGPYCQCGQDGIFYYSISNNPSDEMGSRLQYLP